MNEPVGLLVYVYVFLRFESDDWNVLSVAVVVVVVVGDPVGRAMMQSQLSRADVLYV